MKKVFFVYVASNLHESFLNPISLMDILKEKHRTKIVRL